MFLAEYMQEDEQLNFYRVLFGDDKYIKDIGDPKFLQRDKTSGKYMLKTERPLTGIRDLKWITPHYWDENFASSNDVGRQGWVFMQLDDMIHAGFVFGLGNNATERNTINNRQAPGILGRVGDLSVDTGHWIVTSDDSRSIQFLSPTGTALTELDFTVASTVSDIRGITYLNDQIWLGCRANVEGTFFTALVSYNSKNEQEIVRDVDSTVLGNIVGLTSYNRHL